MPDAPPHILIVEDEHDLRDLVLEGLELHGFSACGADNVDAAMALLREVDAVVADVNIAGESGLDLCRRMRAARPDLPVLIMSGDADARGPALEEGARTFILKPLHLGQLARTLRKVTSQRE